MRLTPLEATLIGTFLGASATLLASVITQRGTRSRERDQRFWEHRADALEETHRIMLAFAAVRNETLASKAVPDDLDPDRPEQPVRLIETKIALYAPRAVGKAHAVWFESLKAFLVSFVGWQGEVNRLAGSTEPEGAQTLIDAAWAMVEARGEELKRSEDALTEALRKASLLRPQRAW
ncbi:hypothetical protein OG407_03605 [Streptomyces sp. NBC_01515]|uniref:hypothetical protein n=1 Tax=Streptomyces sp. NBC_01515 TaxID=2903890 RepID=UPI003866D965